MWLRDDCIEQTCTDGQTCVAGACVAAPDEDPCNLTRLEDGARPEGCATMDAGAEQDAGPGMDAGDVDGGLDAGDEDASTPDAGAPDAGPSDAGPGPLDIYNVVFVTSSAHSAGELGNLASADAICETRATEAGLPDPASYVAFLSITGASAITRLAGSRGWVRPDGLPVMDEPADLQAGEMFYPIAVTETGAQPTVTTVATGTRSDLSVGATCGDYTTLAGNVTAGNAYDGTRYFTDRRFGFAPFEPATACNEPAAIYCFGTGRDVALAPPPPPPGAGGAHVSSAMPAVGPTGIAAMDAACGAGYVAFLPDGANAALDRLGGFAGPWVRPDGVVVAENITQLAGERLLAPPLQTAIGLYVGDGRIWSNERTPDTAGGFTCTDWTDAGGGMARFSYLGRARSFYTRAVSRACGPQGDRVICLSTGAVY